MAFVGGHQNRKCSTCPKGCNNPTCFQTHDSFRRDAVRTRQANQLLERYTHRSEPVPKDTEL